MLEEVRRTMLDARLHAAKMCELGWEICEKTMKGRHWPLCFLVGVLRPVHECPCKAPAFDPGHAFHYISGTSLSRTPNSLTVLSPSLPFKLSIIIALSSTGTSGHTSTSQIANSLELILAKPIKQKTASPFSGLTRLVP
jgi:hypothetical protein